MLQAMSTEIDYDHKMALWKSIPVRLQSSMKSHALGRPVPDSFSPKIQRRLASTVPPKPMVEKTFTDAISTMEQICKDCQKALEIVNFGPDNVQALKAFLWSFSSRQPEPWTYPRACLATPLFTCDDAGFEQLLRKDLEDFVLPASEALDPINWTIEAPQGEAAARNRSYQLARTIDEFTNLTTRMPGGYVDYFRALTSNRCRVRRNLTHVITALEDLQMRETERLDTRLHNFVGQGVQYPLSTWTYLQKLRVMEWTVQLGFELDIYLVDELAGMYWYLSLLASSRAALLDLILEAVESLMSGARQNVDDGMMKAMQLKKSLAMLQSLKAEAQGTAALASALSSVYIMLSYLGCIPEASAKPPFYKPHLKYELRMKPFLTIQSPELPTFEDWDSALHPCGQYSDATSTFTAKQSTYLDGIDEQIRQAKSNFTTMKKLGVAAAGCEGLEDVWSKVRFFSLLDQVTDYEDRICPCCFNRA